MRFPWFVSCSTANGGLLAYCSTCHGSQACKNKNTMLWSNLWGISFSPSEPQLQRNLVKHQNRFSHVKAAAERQHQLQHRPS